MSIRPRKSLLNPDLNRPSALNSKPREKHLLWLDKNENLDHELMATSNNVLNSIHPSVIATYPEAGELYRKIGNWVGLSPDYLLLTPGSDGAIRLTFEVFVGQDDSVIHTSPTFAMYPVYSQMFGALTTTVEYERNEFGLFINPDKIIDDIHKKQPKLVCIPNPDSPSGTVLNSLILEKILKTCEETDTVLLIDEAYHPFYKDTVALWTKTSKNLIVARTFAKAWGAAGLRIGYAIAHPETILLLHKMRPMYEVSSIAVEFMIKMLDRRDEMEASVRRISKGKIYFEREMKGLGFTCLNSEANFIHVAFGDKKNNIHNALNQRVLYRESSSHKSLEGYTRFTAAPLKIMEEVVDIIKKNLKE